MNQIPQLETNPAAKTTWTAWARMGSLQTAIVSVLATDEAEPVSTENVFTFGAYDTAAHAAEIGQWLEGGYILSLLRCALADLYGVMPEFDPSGDREHPGWETIAELRSMVAAIEGNSKVYEEYPGEFPGRDEEDEESELDRLIKSTTWLHLWAELGDDMPCPECSFVGKLETQDGITLCHACGWQEGNELNAEPDEEEGDNG